MIRSYLNGLAFFPNFLQLKSEFGNKEFMIWAIVSSQSCLCWLYRASLSLAAKNIINLSLVSTIWWCPCVESSLVLLEEAVCYDQCVHYSFAFSRISNKSSYIICNLLVLNFFTKKTEPEIHPLLCDSTFCSILLLNS